MSETEKTTATDSGRSAGFQTAGADGAQAMNAFGTVMLETATKFGTEFTEFLSLRMKEDVKARQEMLECRDLQKLAEIQARFFQTAVEQYSAETGKVLQMSSEMLDDAIKRMTGQARG